MKAEHLNFKDNNLIVRWPELIEAAQKVTTYSISGVRYPRIPYGSEVIGLGADDKRCDDCAVVKGQLHIVNCYVERCPQCVGRATWCDCRRDDVEPNYSFKWPTAAQLNAGAWYESLMTPKMVFLVVVVTIVAAAIALFFSVKVRIVDHTSADAVKNKYELRSG